MDVVSVKFQEDILKRMDESIVRHNYNSRTEFIREAVRKQLSELEKDEAMKHFMSLKGSMKKTSAKQDEKTRQEVGEEILKRFNLD